MSKQEISGKKLYFKKRTINSRMEKKMNKRLDELKSKLQMTDKDSETEDGYIKIIQSAKQRERNF